MDILVIKSDVHGLLLKSERCREADFILMANMWGHQLKKDKIDVGTMTARELLEKLAKGELICWESATRCRRKLQEQNPDLRGKNYKKRKSEEKKVVSQLGEFNSNDLKLAV